MLVLQQSELVLGLLVFIALMLAVEGLYLLWRTHRSPQANRMRRRLEALSIGNTPKASALKARMARESPWVQDWLERLSHMQFLDRLIMQSGLDWSVSRVLLSLGGLCISGAVLAYLLFGGDLMLGAAVSVLLPLSLLGFIFLQRAKRLRRIERQLPDALDLMARALRAGHAFGSSLQIAAAEASAPIGNELQMVHEEINFGVTLEQALEHLCERVPLTSVRYFTVAVLLQREAGGNLTEVLGNLSRLLRNREKLLDKIRILSAEGRLSAWILMLLPFALAGVLSLVNPKFMKPLWTDPIGIAMIQYLVVMMVIGALVMRQIIRIRV